MRIGPNTVRSQRSDLRGSRCGPFDFLHSPAGLLLVLSAVGLVAEEPLPPKSGVRFHQELGRPISVFREQVSLREITQRLTRLHGVAILIDRRIDPDRPINVQLSHVSLGDGLDQIAAQCGADAAVIGATVMIGPPTSLDRMRTDAARQVETLKVLLRETNGSRRRDLLQQRTIRWDDLTTPRQLLEMIGAKFQLAVANDMQLPHDLWAGGVLCDMNAAEGLAFVAAQFDLSFSWNDDASKIELHPSPERLTIAESYRIRPERDAQAIAAAQQACPAATFRQEARRLHVEATIGEHEQIAALLSGEQPAAQSAGVDPGLLHDRRFTLNAPRATLITILKTLESQDVKVEYDAAALQSAGVDLNQRITLMLEDVSAEEFFRALCEPLGLTFFIDGKTVHLRPAE
ncbi:MAG: STN domain-containing protein [Planctomycetaceae bacterium]|nr:STN domain-containing protein [Planctomycetaceae bacterium]